MEHFLRHPTPRAHQLKLGMLKRSLLSPFAASLAFCAFAQTVSAQAPPRAGVVEEDLRIDPGQDVFLRGKNLFDSAQSSVDLETRRERYLRAANIFSTYINENPGNPNAEAAWYYCGSSYYQAGEKEDAKRCFSTLLNRYGQGKWAAAGAYTLAADHYNQREYALAVPLFERFAANSPRPEDKPKGFLFAGNSYRLLGRDQEAIGAYKKVVDDPAGAIYKTQALIAIAHMTFKAGKLQEALEIFEGVANSNSANQYRGEAALHAALAATKLGKTELAEKYLRFILDTPDMDEWRPDAQTALMENHLARKEYRQVLDLFRKSSLKAEGDKEAVRLMIAARAMMKLKQPADASELFREVERMVKPENDLAFQAAYYRLNCFFQIEGRHVADQVDGFLQLYAKAHPNDTRIHTAMLMKAETLFAENEIAAAAKTYSQIDPTLLSESNRPGFLYQRGWCLAEAGDAQGATRSLSDFISKYPDDPRVYPALVKRAKAYAEVGEPAKAIADFDRLTADEKTPSELSSLAWLESARTRRKEGNIENMLIRYKGLLSKVDDLTDNLKAEANYWIGWGMVKTNTPKEAAPFLNTARELRPEAYAKHSGLLLALSHFASQDPKSLASEIDLAIKGNYVDEIPNQAVQWSAMQSYQAGDFATAARFFKLVANYEEPRTTPKEVWRYLAKSLIEVGDTKAALPAVSNVLDVEEEASWKADALLDRARALFAQKEFDESRKAADEALLLRPQGRTSAHLLIVSGDLFVQQGNPGQAAADYLKVIGFHEDQELKPLALHKISAVLESQNKSAEAAKYKAQLANDFPNWKAP